VRTVAGGANHLSGGNRGDRLNARLAESIAPWPGQGTLQMTFPVASIACDIPELATRRTGM